MEIGTVLAEDRPGGVFIDHAMVATDKALSRVPGHRPRRGKQMMLMPKTLQGILDHADEITAKFEQYNSDPVDSRPAEPLQRARRAVQARAAAERAIAVAGAVAVDDLREAGYSWPLVGAVLGTSGEAARQRYGRPVSTKPDVPILTAEGRRKTARPVGTGPTAPKTARAK